VKFRSFLPFLLSLIALVLGAITVVAAPWYQAIDVRPSPSSLLVIEQPPPTPSPTPTPSPSSAPTVIALTTPNGTVTFPVPVYRQTMNLDCETAALQMGLSAMGHTYSQQQLFAYQQPDTRPPVMSRLSNGQKIVVQWGDPYTNFVGDVNGADLIPTGFGIYYPIILSIAQSHGAPNAYGQEGFKPAEIYGALAAGHPVVAWTETGWERPYVGYWTAWDGRRIKYSLVEHAVTLSGVSATQVRVNDPWKSGSQYWFSKNEFERSWADFNNMAVVLQ
jgi:uncharacterized protein YvpB